MKTNDIVTVADLMTFKKEIIEQIAVIPQPKAQAKFVNGKVLIDVTGLKSYNSMMKHFGQFSKKIGGRRFFDLEAVTQHLKEG